METMINLQFFNPRIKFVSFIIINNQLIYQWIYHVSLMNDAIWQESIFTKCCEQSKYSVSRNENVRRSQYELRNKQTPPSSHNLLSFLQEGAMRASWNNHR